MSVLQEARAALTLLTILPSGRRDIPQAATAGAGLWFPLVGAVVGVAAAGAFAVADSLLGGLYAAAVALTTSAVLTGALHHDGLADTADGLGVRGDVERRLDVMRDSGIGAFGALALIAFALLATGALSRLDPAEAAAALVAGHALGRWAALAQLTFVEPARQDGLGASFSAQPVTFAIGSAIAVAVALVAAGALAGLVAIASAAIAAAATALLARAATGGRTGDTLGAAVLLTELAVYSALAAYLVA